MAATRAVWRNAGEVRLATATRWRAQERDSTQVHVPGILSISAAVVGKLPPSFSTTYLAPSSRYRALRTYSVVRRGCSVWYNHRLGVSGYPPNSPRAVLKPLPQRGDQSLLPSKSCTFREACI